MFYCGFRGFVCFSFSTAFLVILGGSLAPLKQIEIQVKSTESSLLIVMGVNQVIYQLIFLLLKTMVEPNGQYHTRGDNATQKNFKAVQKGKLRLNSYLGQTIRNVTSSSLTWIYKRTVRSFRDK